jgi:hypothetical protein
MSDLFETAPAESTTQTERSAPRVDLFALTRALVFTKEAYRTLRSKVQGRRNETMRITPAEDAAAQPEETFVIPPLMSKALTPWDLMDEADSTSGVTFSEFQARQLARQRRRAA